MCSFAWLAQCSLCVQGSVLLAPDREGASGGSPDPGHALHAYKKVPCTIGDWLGETLEPFLPCIRGRSFLEADFGTVAAYFKSQAIWQFVRVSCRQLKCKENAELRAPLTSDHSQRMG